MKDTQKNSLFTELTTNESATINGGYHYRPCYDYYPSYWGGRRRSNTTVNVSTYVNVEVDN